MKRIVQTCLQRFGIQLKRYPDPDLQRRRKLLDHFAIDMVLDVGANEGQYAIELRKLGYSGRIVSFEPLQGPYEISRKRSRRAYNWEVHHFGLGDDDSQGVMHVALNSHSSSLLDMLPIHLEGAPDSAYVRDENVSIRKLDSIFHDVCRKCGNVLLKIDAQGYEDRVLAGASKSMAHIKMIQLEMSLVPLYKGERTFSEMIGLLSNLGYNLYSLENGFSNPSTGQLLQVDGLFVSDTAITSVR